MGLGGFLRGGRTEQELVITSYYTRMEPHSSRSIRVYNLKASFKRMTCKGFKRSKNMIEEQEYMKSC